MKNNQVDYKWNKIEIKKKRDKSYVVGTMKEPGLHTKPQNTKL